LSGYTENGGECQQQQFTHDKLFHNSKDGLFLIKIRRKALRPESKPVSLPFFWPAAVRRSLMSANLAATEMPAVAHRHKLTFISHSFIF
jgi:hypothetical protein